MKKCSAAAFVKAVAKCLIGASSNYLQQLTAAYIIVSVGLETRTKQRIKGKGVCVQCDFDIDCIRANNGYEHLKLSYHHGLLSVFPFPCESKGHKGVFSGHILPSSAQESNYTNLCLSLPLGIYSRD